MDYLDRLIVHATLSPPVILSLVYYIDRLCVLYTAFSISSLTVHRYLIAAATVASKGLCDTFWTNNTYARIGGVTIKELALLELDFLKRMDWRIIPESKVLVDYYENLVTRTPGYTLEDRPVVQKMVDEPSGTDPMASHAAVKESSDTGDTPKPGNGDIATEPS
jgi:hypothetical protein